ncbi:MAG: hypothetical protein SF123_06205 [Chloroflexota bacterium]|nr:hypothetical protein [Chloroflexota bacterium]
MMGEDYVRIYPEDGIVRVISNNGDCVVKLLDWVREQEAVEDIELEDGGISDYVMPDGPDGPNEQAVHNLYHYVVILSGDSDAQRFAQNITDAAEDLFAEAGICEVTLEP